MTFWWKENKKTLIEIAQKESHAFVYYGPKILEQMEKLKKVHSLHNLFYSIKANDHHQVIKLIYKWGFGLECVSMEELIYIKSIIPKIHRERVLFTPNFSSREEYRYAFSQGYMVTVDNEYPLLHWGEIFYGQKIFLRIDPGKGRGIHPYVKTAGLQSKFGIRSKSAISLIPWLVKNRISVVGLHAHLGSGIANTHHWIELANYLGKLAKNFPEVKYLNLGGGLSVPMKRLDREVDLDNLDNQLKRVKKHFPGYQLFMEPGRYLVAQAGVLVARVNQLKTKGRVNFIGISTGMNSLIRPSLYGSYHQIVNLSQESSKCVLKANVVGPICESADFLGLSRHFPKTKEGDIILIDCAGAYGAVMSSRYNKRSLSKEVFLKN